MFIVLLPLIRESTARDPLPRGLPVLTPTMVLSLRVPLCGRQKDQWLACRSTATSASSSPPRLVTSAGPRTRLLFGSSRSDICPRHHQLRSLSRSWRNHPWSSGAQIQHCPRATVLFFYTTDSYSLSPLPRVLL